MEDTHLHPVHLQVEGRQEVLVPPVLCADAVELREVLQQQDHM